LPIVTGDTKVVEQGKGDGVFITTTGVGVVPAAVEISGDRARPGDASCVSGTIGDHGVAIMSLRENLSFETTIRSDTAALHGLVAAMVDRCRRSTACAIPRAAGSRRRSTSSRRQSGAHVIREAAIPVARDVAAACEFLGLDRSMSPTKQARRDLRARRRAAPRRDARASARRDAARSARSIADPHRFVQMDTRFGGPACVDWLTGEQLPRSADAACPFLAHALQLPGRSACIVRAGRDGHEVRVEFDIHDAVTAGRWRCAGRRRHRAVPQARIPDAGGTSALPRGPSRDRRRPRALGARLGDRRGRRAGASR
jgi:hypothetical protein